MERVVLRDTRDADGPRHLEACLQPDGALVIEGQDLGAGVEGVFGAGLREYEWRWRVAPDDVEAALEALGSEAGEPPLAVLARWVAARPHRDPGPAIRAAGIAIELDTRVGD